jgi:hypothetical protein
MPSSDPNTVVVLVVRVRYESRMLAAAILIGDTATTAGGAVADRGRVIERERPALAQAVRELAGKCLAGS